jgi:hypothetical protein
MFTFNPLLNPAPGAPIHRAERYYQGGSAALGTPTTQAYPTRSNPIHGYARAPGALISQTLSEAVGTAGSSAQYANDASGDYFQSVAGTDTPTPLTQAEGREHGLVQESSANASSLDGKTSLDSAFAGDIGALSALGRLSIKAEEEVVSNRSTPTGKGGSPNESVGSGTGKTANVLEAWAIRGLMGSATGGVVGQERRVTRKGSNEGKPLSVNGAGKTEDGEEVVRGEGEGKYQSRHPSGRASMDITGSGLMVVGDANGERRASWGDAGRERD